MKVILLISILISFNLCSDAYSTNFCALWGKGNSCEGFANLNMANSLDYRDNFLSHHELTLYILRNEQNSSSLVSEVNQAYESGLSDIFTPVTYDQVNQMNKNASDRSVPDGDVNNFKSSMQHDSNRPCLVVGPVSCKLYQNNRDNNYFCQDYINPREIWQWSNGKCDKKSWKYAEMYKNCHTYTYADLNNTSNAVERTQSSRPRGSPRWYRKTGNNIKQTRTQKSSHTCLKCKLNYAMQYGKCVKTQHEGCSLVDRSGNCIKCDLSSGFVDAENNNGCIGFVKYTLNGTEKRATIDGN